MGEVKTIIPESKDGFLKNIAELTDEYRRNNIQCMMLCYRRKDDSTRTYFLNHDDPYMFKTLIRLEHDILGLYSVNCDFEEWEE